jgi:cyclophilin family peptidyl-prolyl cis-trans isomerase
VTVAVFMDLVERRFFDGGRWHRVVPNFVVQDGDPRGDGWGGPGFVLRDEINPVRYDVGTVGMALSGPDTGGSQYFITHSAQPHLDGTYTIFGRLVAGVPTLDAIGQGDRIRSIHR